MYTNEKFQSYDLYIRLFCDKGNRLFDLTQLNDVLTHNANLIKRYAYTVQDEDFHFYVHRVYAPEKSFESVTPAHVRLKLEFLPQCPQSISNVAGWFNIPEEEVCPIRGRFEDSILALTFEGAPTKEKFSSEGITANFDVQCVIDYAIEQAKLEYTFFRILYGNDRRLLPCSEVERIRNRLLQKTQPFFDSPHGKEELEYWISDTLFNTPF